MFVKNKNAKIFHMKKNALLQDANGPMKNVPLLQHPKLHVLHYFHKNVIHIMDAIMTTLI